MGGWEKHFCVPGRNCSSKSGAVQMCPEALGLLRGSSGKPALPLARSLRAPPPGVRGLRACAVPQDCGCGAGSHSSSPAAMAWRTREEVGHRHGNVPRAPAGQEFIPDSLSRALCLSGHISQAHTQIALILRKEKQLTLIKPLIHYDIYSIKVKWYQNSIKVK